MKNLIKKYFTSFVYFYRYLRYRIVVVIGLSLLVGILDGFGLTMFLPLLKIAGGQNEASGDNLGKLSFLVDGLKSLGLELNLIVILSTLFVFFILKGIVKYFTARYNVVINNYFMSTIRLNLTNLFTSYSYKKFVGGDIGHIQNSFTSEVGRVSKALRAFMQCIQKIIIALVYLAFVFMVTWQFALLVCIGGLLTNFIYNSIYKKTKKKSYELTKHNSNFHGLVVQYIGNYKYLKATGLLRAYALNLKRQIKQIELTSKKMGFLNAIMSSTREPLLIGVVCIVILSQVYVLGGSLTAVLISLLFFYRALTAVMGFQTFYNGFLSVSGSMANITNFEKELKNNKDADGNQKIESFQQAIQFRNVSFSYNEMEVLTDINLDVKRNQSIALVGESGSGKTTLVNLMSGLLRPNSGQIHVDGHDMTRLKLNTYQSRIGYIAQEPVIFNDTIFNNVTFWDKPTAENKEKFETAVRQASIKPFIDELDKKEQTWLGNRGINLSGGQKQRISIARELYKDIDILILDEATSALDSETEKEIQYNIESLIGKYTLIIIAHRLSTIRNVDKVYLMSKGEIKGAGCFEDLTQSSHQFKRMVALQEI